MDYLFILQLSSDIQNIRLRGLGKIPQLKHMQLHAEEEGNCCLYYWITWCSECVWCDSFFLFFHFYGNCLLITWWKQGTFQNTAKKFTLKLREPGVNHWKKTSDDFRSSIWMNTLEINNIEKISIIEQIFEISATSSRL